LAYNRNTAGLGFEGLSHYLWDVVDKPDYVFEEVLPRIAKLALRLPELIPEPIPLLVSGQSFTVTLSQVQVSFYIASTPCPDG
jgi:hypothetical protein